MHHRQSKQASIKISHHLLPPSPLIFHPYRPQLFPNHFHVWSITSSRCGTLECQTKDLLENFYIYWFVHQRINQPQHITFIVAIDSLQNVSKWCQRKYHITFKKQLCCCGKGIFCYLFLREGVQEQVRSYTRENGAQLHILFVAPACSFYQCTCMHFSLHLSIMMIFFIYLHVHYVMILC